MFFLFFRDSLNSSTSSNSLIFQFKIFSDVIRYIQEYYVDESYKESEKLAPVIEKAVDLMLRELDPYSDLLNPDEWKEMRIHSKGEFGGIGIQIGLREGKLTVISPIEGTPAFRAGLEAGDIIVEVDGKSTKGWSLQDAVKHLRGKPGTKVKIKIKREGIDDLLEFEITRAIIKIKSVPYFGMIEENIGYIKLAEFSEKAKRELTFAIDSLKKLGMKKLILDLRFNPGGLLSAAVEVADIFLPKGREIVFTKARGDEIERSYRSIKNDGFSEEIPLIVLVNRGSASASEIVAGALQDWDRAVIIGDTTFGKGSVQKLFPLEGGYRLKLTTSLYYLPSGRSIHRFSKDKRKEKEEKFYTLILKREKRGKYVGIIPDIVLKMKDYPEFFSNLRTKRIFFSYALKLKNRGIKKLEDLDIDEFTTFVKEKIKDFNREKVEKYKDEIVYFINMELGQIYEGDKGRYKVMLEKDDWVKKALEILQKVEKKEEIFKYVKM